MRFLLVVLLLPTLCFAGNDRLEEYQGRAGWFESRNLSQPGVIPKKINNLIFAQSPYLLSHALQPIDWEQWPDKAAQVWAEQNKLIFISIGYDTCHWCHVMAEESFAHPLVADVLNAHFISIKVDREQHPLVDEKFRYIAEQLKGEAGWPMNLILLPSGEVVWLDSYLPREEFFKVISMMAQRWQVRPQSLQAFAKRQSQLLDAGDTPESSPQDFSKAFRELSHTKLMSLEAERLGQGPRFLHEPWLDGLLKLAVLGDEKALAGVKALVDDVLLSPVFDPVEGGFHRYAIDGQFDSPHFEKMLYTQAGMMSALAELYRITGDEVYRQVMLKTHHWVNSNLRTAAGYASALSAVSGGTEGGYYRLPDSLGSLDRDSLEADGLEIANQLLKAKTLSAHLKSHQQLSQLRQGDIKPNRDDKVILAWNAAYGNALLLAYSATKEPVFERDALWLLQQLARFEGAQGNLYRIEFEGGFSTTAISEDRAWYALFLARFAALDSSVTGLDIALTALLPLEQPLDIPKTNKDAETPAWTSAMYQAAFLGFRLTGDKRLRKLMVDIKSSLAGKSWDEQYSLVATIAMAQEGYTAEQRQFFGAGHGVAHLIEGDGKLWLDLELEKGWHVNANPTNDAKLQATTLLTPLTDGWQPVYPTGIKKQLGFTSEPLALYEGKVRLGLHKTTAEARLGLIEVKLQVCSDRVCLLPETLKFWRRYTN